MRLILCYAKLMNIRFILWLSGCFLITIFCGLVYISSQQIIRHSANYPLVEIASDISNASRVSQIELDNSLPKQKVDAIYSSGSPYVIIFDSKFNIIATNATAEGKQIEEKPPFGVFENVSDNLPYFFTWEPVSSFRYATVVREIKLDNKKGYVLVARSLGYVEQLGKQMFIYAVFAWILGIGVVSIAAILISKCSKKK